MITYNVYKHPIIGYEAIKQGFSWPGYLFTWVWALIKKLWVYGAILFPLVFICNGFMYEQAASGKPEDIIAGLLISMIPMYVVGRYGNAWREKSIRQRGFELNCTVIAASSEGALAEAVKPENERNTTVTNITDDFKERSASLFTNEDGVKVKYTGTILQEGNMLRVTIAKHIHGNQEQILNELLSSDGDVDKYLRLNTRFTFADFK